jgi:hypothetical protein
MARNLEDYAYWRAALRGDKPAIRAEMPECGFYKRRTVKNGPWLPLAIWRDDASGELVCGFQGAMVDASDQWSWVADKPVTEAAYRYHIANGHWEDEAAPVEATAANSNMPADPYSALKAEVEDKLTQARGLVKETQKEGHQPSEVEANKARNIQAGLLELNRKADAMFEEEKEPIRKAGKAIDDKFGFRKNIEAASKALKGIFEAWMKAEEARRKAEAQKKFEEELAKAEAARKEAEEARKALEAEDPILAAITEPEPVIELPKAPAPVSKIQVGGGTGRRAGLKDVYEGVIEDWAAAAAHYSTHPDVQAIVQKLANADARNSKGTAQVPGVRMHQDRKAA